MRPVVTENGVECWSLSPSKYVQEAVKNCRKHLKENFDGKFTMPNNAPNAFPIDYEQQVDTTPGLNPDESLYHQFLIGIVRWLVEIGRVNILDKCSLLSSHLALLREGHMNTLLHLMRYLELNHNSRMFFDPIILLLMSRMLNPFRGLNSDYRLATVTHNRERKKLHTN